MPTLRVTNLKILLTADERPNYAIAAAAGLSPTVLSQYAKGVAEVALHHRGALAAVLGVHPDELDGWQDLQLATDKQTDR